MSLWIAGVVGTVLLARLAVLETPVLGWAVAISSRGGRIALIWVAAAVIRLLRLLWRIASGLIVSLLGILAVSLVWRAAVGVVGSGHVEMQ